MAPRPMERSSPTSFAFVRTAADPVGRAAGLARARRARAGVRGDRRALPGRAAAPRAALSGRGAGRGRAPAGAHRRVGALQRGDDVRDLSAWLYRIVHNTALNHCAAAGDDYAELGSRWPGGPPEEEIERRAVVRQTLGASPSSPSATRGAPAHLQCRGARRRRSRASLGVSEGAVRQLVHRARMTLRAAATAIAPLPLAAGGGAAGRRRAGPPTAERIAELAGAGAAAFARQGRRRRRARTSTAAAAGPRSSRPALRGPTRARPAPVAGAPSPRPARSQRHAHPPVASSTATPTATAQHESARREKRTTARPRRVHGQDAQHGGHSASGAHGRRRPRPRRWPPSTPAPIIKSKSS